MFLILLDFLLGSLIKYFYFRQTSGPEFVTTYSIEKTNADVLIFGSSRANHHYHPAVFEEQLKMSCQNAGRDGFDIFYHYAVLKAVLKRYTPKIIILDFNSEEFIKSKGSYDRISALLPYYRDHPEIHKIVELKSKYEKFKLISSVYPFNSTLSYILLGNSRYNRIRRNEINGYVPMTKTFEGKLYTYKVLNKYESDSTKEKIYESFILDCIASGTKLYVIHSPYYARFAGMDKSLDLGQKTAEKYNIPFYCFLNDSIFINNPKLFADESHLNNEGAKFFTKLVTEIIIPDF